MKRKILVSMVILLGVSLAGASTLTNFADITETSTVDAPQFWLQSDDTLNTASDTFTSTALASGTNTFSFSDFEENRVYSFDYGFDVVITLSGNNLDDVSADGVIVAYGAEEQTCDPVVDSGSAECTVSFASPTQVDADAAETIDLQVDSTDGNAELDDGTNIDMVIN